MGPPWIAAQLRGRVLLLGSRAPAGMWWRGPCARGGGELHLGSLRGTLDPGTFAEEDWGFLAQQTLEKLLKALLVLHCQEPPCSHSLQRLLAGARPLRRNPGRRSRVTGARKLRGAGPL